MARLAALSPGRRGLLLAIAAALIAVAIGVVAGIALLRDSTTGGQDAEPLLAVALPDADGREQSIGQWRGRLLVVNFWATWCAPCREEMPEFMKLQAQHGARGLQFVGVAVDEAPKVKQFATETGLNYPALIGGYGAMELSRAFGNRVMALPFTIVVDRGGRIVFTQLGPVKPRDLERIIAQYL